ncbi:gp078 [Rhodococcus phage ReqiDocB7]|uniref:gp078 n=1 Tax=Rhodococcus phage ReqiDocB7 TaxID=691966 RepID=UPI0001CDD867|nr:gp078 [Rhodococcus phage ReqiDocB7]ADD80864.1 gp078 [Rhodococcus phage ReqiDocB7]
MTYHHMDNEEFQREHTLGKGHSIGVAANSDGENLLSMLGAVFAVTLTGFACLLFPFLLIPVVILGVLLTIGKLSELHDTVVTKAHGKYVDYRAEQAAREAAQAAALEADFQSRLADIYAPNPDLGDYPTEPVEQYQKIYEEQKPLDHKLPPEEVF